MSDPSEKPRRTTYQDGLDAHAHELAAIIDDELRYVMAGRVAG